MSNTENQIVSIIGIGAIVVLSLYLFLPHMSGIGSSVRGPAVPGLRNWANWCFCNSVLQSLSSLPTFRQWLDQNIEEEKSLTEKSTDSFQEESSPLSRTMRGMIRVLNTVGPAKVLSSTPLVQALEIVQKNRISRAQQDAQEFLHMLLESIAAEQNNLPASVSIQQMSQSAERQGHAYKRLPFEGALRTTSTCTSCHHELKAQVMPFLELTLLPPNKTQLSVSDCIESTLSHEMIEDYNCIHCQLSAMESSGKVDTTQDRNKLAADPDYELPKSFPKSHVTLERRVEVTLYPQILILHINRSLFGTSYATRNGIHLTFEKELKLGPSDGGVEYELKSLVTHQGSHERGHYISYRRLDGTWYVISDENVRTTTLDQVLTLGGYTFLMFYEKIDPAKKMEKAAARRRNKKRAKEVGSVKGQQPEAETVENEDDAMFDAKL